MAKRRKKKFIKKAIKRPGQLHRDLGIPQGQVIPLSKLRAAAKRKGKIGQRARFALTLRKIRPKKKRAPARAKTRAKPKRAKRKTKAKRKRSR